MIATLKRQQFKGSKTDITELRTSKCLGIDLYDIEEGQGSDGRHDPFSLHLPKELNRPIDLGKGTRNLNHLLCIPKLPF